MNWRPLVSVGVLAFTVVVHRGQAADTNQLSSPPARMNSKVLSAPTKDGLIGPAHGDIAVSTAQDIYVSVEGGERPGIQVYNAKGLYLRNLPNVPNDLHGFIIRRDSDGQEYIYAVSLKNQKVYKLTLRGEVTLEVSTVPIPATLKRNPITLTGVAVAPNGDIYAVEGYGLDYIHRFDRRGKYISSFGGNEVPWSFEQCHKLAIDVERSPIRLLCADRRHNRIVAMDLDGNFKGVLASGLKLPSALAISKRYIAVAELEGRVTLLDHSGKVLAHFGANDKTDQVATNTVEPGLWKGNTFYAPHGITFDHRGDLLVTEWSKWGRVVKIVRSN